MYRVSGVPLVQMMTAFKLTIEHYWAFLATLLPTNDLHVFRLQTIHATLHS